MTYRAELDFSSEADARAVLALVGKFATRTRLVRDLYAPISRATPDYVLPPEEAPEPAPVAVPHKKRVHRTKASQTGAGKVVLEALAGGTKTYASIMDALTRAGYSPSTTSPTTNALLREGVIEQHEDRTEGHPVRRYFAKKGA